MIPKAHAKAKNKYLKSDNPNKPTLYICIYIYILKLIEEVNLDL